MTKPRKLTRWLLLPSAAVIGLGACSTGVDTYNGLVQMVEHKNNYSCAELIDAAETLSADDERRARRQLDDIGCSSAAGTRTDRG